jgi:hypothetical protein
MFYQACRQLSDLHLSLHNYVEAAKSLLLVVEGIKWSKNMVENLDEFPSESASTRKERVYKIAVEYYKKGKFWEKSIGLLKELERHYHEEFQYDKLPEVLVTLYLNTEFN